ncbi:MAG: site-specific DNA-methyltransferase [Actinomycetota bacterium]|nr:site-specific DNA-methyltransferase [Actinomycetota bacterium]
MKKAKAVRNEEKKVRITCTGTEVVDIDDLTPFQGKFKKLAKGDYEKLRAQIIAVGVTAAATVWKDGDKLYLLDGHQRRETLSRMKLEGFEVPPIPVNFADCRTKAEAKVKVLALASTYGSVDEAGLIDFAKEAGLDLATISESFRFPDIDLDHLVRSAGAAMMSTGADLDKAAPRPAKPVTKLGDIWKMGEHRLICGDSTDPEVLKRLMDGKKAVLMNTDPPYGINFVENAKSKGQSKEQKDIANDELDGAQLQAFLEATIRAAVPHLKDNAAFYLWHPMLTQGTFFAAAAAADILISRQIIWVKPSLVFGRGDYHWRHELAFYGWRRGHRPPFYGPRNQTTIWEAGRENDGIHPTQKPVKLFEIPLMNHTKKGELIYEPFAGSGSQFIAAEASGRVCYGVELDRGYCDSIVKRWENLTGKKAERAK